MNLYTRLKEKSGEAWSADFAAHASSAAAAPTRRRPRTRRRARRPQRRGPAPAARDPAPAATSAPSPATAATPPCCIAQAPLIAGLIGLSLLYGGSDIAYTKPKNTILFLLAMTAVWFGCSNAARELVKERAIYLRERMVNLRIVPYVLSKVVVLAAFAFIQCVLLLFILDVWFGVPGSMGLLLGGMLLASLVGILLGLALSALVGSADRAMTLLPILLIPQVLFTIPAVQMDMKGPAGHRRARHADVVGVRPAAPRRAGARRPRLRRRDRRAAAGGRPGAHDPGPLRGDGAAGLPALPAPRGHRDHLDGLAAGRAGKAPAGRGSATGGRRRSTRWRWRAFALALLAAAIALQRRHDRRA